MPPFFSCLPPLATPLASQFHGVSPAKMAGNFSCLLRGNLSFSSMTRLDENAISLAKAFFNVFGFSLILEGGRKLCPACRTYVGRKAARRSLEKESSKKVQKYVAHKFVLGFAAVKFFPSFHPSNVGRQHNDIIINLNMQPWRTPYTHSPFLPSPCLHTYFTFLADKKVRKKREKTFTVTVSLCLRLILGRRPSFLPSLLPLEEFPADATHTCCPCFMRVK